MADVVGAFAGSFDPITLGHTSAIAKAAHLFSRLYIIVSHNPNKKHTIDLPTRVKLTKLAIDQELPRDISRICKVVEHQQGLVAHICAQIGVRFLVRSIRSAGDATAELNLARFNSQIFDTYTRTQTPPSNSCTPLPGRNDTGPLQTIFIPADQSLAHISSSAVKNIFAQGGCIKAYVPQCVFENITNFLPRN